MSRDCAGRKKRKQESPLSLPPIANNPPPRCRPPPPLRPPPPPDVLPPPLLSHTHARSRQGFRLRHPPQHLGAPLAAGCSQRSESPLGIYTCTRRTERTCQRGVSAYGQPRSIASWKLLGIQGLIQTTTIQNTQMDTVSRGPYPEGPSSPPDSAQNRARRSAPH